VSSGTPCWSASEQTASSAMMPAPEGLADIVAGLSDKTAKWRAALVLAEITALPADPHLCEASGFR